MCILYMHVSICGVYLCLKGRKQACGRTLQTLVCLTGQNSDAMPRTYAFPFFPLFSKGTPYKKLALANQTAHPQIANI